MDVPEPGRLAFGEDMIKGELELSPVLGCAHADPDPDLSTHAAPASSALPERVEQSDEVPPEKAAATSAVDPRQKQEVAGAIPVAAGEGTTEVVGVPPKEEEEEALPEPPAVARNVDERQALRAKKWQEELDTEEEEAVDGVEMVEEEVVVRPRKPVVEAPRKVVVRPEVDEEEGFAEINFVQDDEEDA